MKHVGLGWRWSLAELKLPERVPQLLDLVCSATWCALCPGGPGLGLLAGHGVELSMHVRRVWAGLGMGHALVIRCQLLRARVWVCVRYQVQVDVAIG